MRKYFQKKSPFKADNEHLHQLIFLYFKKKLNGKNTVILNEFIVILDRTLNSFIVILDRTLNEFNVLSSITINSFNFILIFLASKNPNLTSLQLKLIIIALVIYCMTYILCKKKLFFKK